MFVLRLVSIDDYFFVVWCGEVLNGCNKFKSNCVIKICKVKNEDDWLFGWVWDSEFEIVELDCNFGKDEYVLFGFLILNVRLDYFLNVLNLWFYFVFFEYKFISICCFLIGLIIYYCVFFKCLWRV